MDTKTLSQLNVNNFQDYVKFLPERDVPDARAGPDQNLHPRRLRRRQRQSLRPAAQRRRPISTNSRSPPSAARLDVHIYDIARVEVLAGPQGTLYGASSEAGTIRIITNQPSTAGFAAGYDVQGNYVDHGERGLCRRGLRQHPGDLRTSPIRLVGFDERDAGYIDNVLARGRSRPRGDGHQQRRPA